MRCQVLVGLPTRRTQNVGKQIPWWVAVFVTTVYWTYVLLSSGHQRIPEYCGCHHFKYRNYNLHAVLYSSDCARQDSDLRNIYYGLWYNILSEIDDCWLHCMLFEMSFFISFFLFLKFCSNSSLLVTFGRPALMGLCLSWQPAVVFTCYTAH